MTRSCIYILALFLIGFLSCNRTDLTQLLVEAEEYLSNEESLKAYETYTLILGKYHNVSEAYYGRSQANYLRENYSEAITDIENAMNLDSSISNYFVHRGNIFEILLDDKKAFNDYKHAIVIDNNPYAYNCIGSILADSLKYKEARLFYTIAITLHQDAVFYNNRGHLFEEIGHSDSAIIDYNKAIELDSMNSEYFCNRAITKYRINDVEGSVNDFTKAIQVDSLHDQSYYYRALIYYEQGKNEKAFEDYETSAKLGNKFAQKKLKENY